MTATGPAGSTAPAGPTAPTRSAGATGPAAHDWRRTHAVIVAVESYAGSAGWNLDGPVYDAVSMHRWLTGQGVPEGNIRLLASPLEHNRETLAAAAPAGYRTAERATVRAVFKEELRDLDGDWLWVYWAGHGVQVSGGRWSLLYPEARDRDLVGLDADNLVHTLRTDGLPGHGVPRVTVVIDACRRALPVRQQHFASVPDVLSEAAQSNLERQFFLMRASSAGGIAKNPDGKGAFTSVLMRHLAKTPSGVPDLRAVWQGVRSEFDRLNEGAGAGGSAGAGTSAGAPANGDARRPAFGGGPAQIPTMHVIDWDGNGGDFSWRPSQGGTPVWRQARARLLLETQRVLAGDPGATAAVTSALCSAFAAEPPAYAVAAEELADWALSHDHGAATLLHALACRDAASGGTARAEGTGDTHTEQAHELCRVLQDGQWLTRSEYDTLVPLLEVLDQRALDDLVAAARTEIPAAPSLPRTAAPLADALEALLPKRHQLPQLLRVIERFVAQPGDAAAAFGLREWSLTCARRIGMEGALLDRRADAEERVAEERAARGCVTLAGAPASAPAGDERIQIRLHPTNAPKSANSCDTPRSYEIWARREEEVVPLAKADTPAPLEEIQRGLDELLSRHGRTQETLVEFFLAADDLELDVQCWRLGAAGPVERFLGTDYPVVVRCTEFRTDGHRHLWQHRWERVGSAGTADLHWVCDEAATSRKVYGALQADADIPGVAVTTPKRARAEVFTACLFGGVPVVVWHGERELATAEGELKRLLGTDELRTLPQRLRRMRAASDADESQPGRHVALLWDDPHRPLPEPLDLSAP